MLTKKYPKKILQFFCGVLLLSFTLTSFAYEEARIDSVEELLKSLLKNPLLDSRPIIRELKIENNTGDSIDVDVDIYVGNASKDDADTFIVKSGRAKIMARWGDSSLIDYFLNGDLRTAKNGDSYELSLLLVEKNTRQVKWQGTALLAKDQFQIVPHDGKGTQILSNGLIYEGDFANGHRTGKGVLIWKNGQRYEGDFVNGDRHGKGILTWSSGRYEGNFELDRYSGYGVLSGTNGERYEGNFLRGLQHGIGKYFWPDGAHYEGEFVKNERTGKGVFTWKDGDRYEGNFVDGAHTGEGVMIAKGKRTAGYFVDGVVQDKDTATLMRRVQNPDAVSLFECATALDSKCILARIKNGDDVNVIDKNAWTPIYHAISTIRDGKREDSRGINAVRTLIASGADLDYRVNPAPLAIDKPLTPKEFLEGSFQRGMFNFPAPAAPKTLALFNSSDLMEQNKRTKIAISRAKEAGFSFFEYQDKEKKISKIRALNTFDAFSEAFLVTREKEDFIAAQNAAKTPSQKRKLEYLAIIATSDKSRIFDIDVKLGDIQGKSKGQDRNDEAKLLIFSIPTKSSTVNFSGLGSLRVSGKSPVGILKYGYRVYVKHTLQYTLQRTQTTNFIISMSQTTDEVFREDQFVTYEIIPGKKSMTSNLNFGNVTLSSQMQALGGISNAVTVMKGDPELITEIIRIEAI